MSADVLDLQREMDALQQTYIKLQQNKSKLIDIQHENEQVKQDMAALKSDAQVYQMVGPVLVPKTQGEAKTAVNDKLTFIKDQLASIDTRMKELEGKMIEANKKRSSLDKKQPAQHA